MRPDMCFISTSPGKPAAVGIRSTSSRSTTAFCVSSCPPFCVTPALRMSSGSCLQRAVSTNRLSSPNRPLEKSFPPKSDHRINLRRTPCRHVRREHCNHQQSYCHCDQASHVDGRDPVQRAVHEMSEREDAGESNCEANHRQLHAVAQNQEHNIAPLGA